jgi:D-3-phosphoglycerate dehydrogenase
MGVVRADKLEDIYNTSDFITIHLPKNKDTIGMFGKEEFYKMKKGK